MKNTLKILYLALIMLSMNACFDDFLEVNPKTDITTDLFFESETGFKDALSGVYVRMKEPGAYGHELTIGALEHMVSNWDVQANTVAYFLSRWDYQQQDAERTMNGIFSGLFRIVAAANAILDRIDDNKEVFQTAGLYELIKGEALAIRAYSHFDVLRLFGSVPADMNAGISLPYASSLSREPVTHLSYTQFRTQLFQDLQAAENLLEMVDPILNHSIEAVSRPGVLDFNPDDTFFGYRNIRMNYYAVKGLQARMHLWFGDTSDALEAASMVLNATNPDGSDKFVLASAADFAAGNYVMTKEHLFGLHDFDLVDRYSRTFGRGLVYRGLDDIFVREQLYGNTGTDIREANMWEIIATNFTPPQRYVIKKYKAMDAGANMSVDYRRIPMLRLSEMYFIAMETAPAPEAQAYWDAFSTARNISITNLPESIPERHAMLVHEYRKEFYAEGQSFYAYKRTNSTKANILWSPAIADVNYVVPLPLTEVIQNN